MSVVRLSNVISHRLPVQTGWADSDGYYCHKQSISVIDYAMKEGLPLDWMVHVDFPNAFVDDIASYLKVNKRLIRLIPKHKRREFKLVLSTDLFNSINCGKTKITPEELEKLSPTKQLYFLVSYPKSHC